MLRFVITLSAVIANFPLALMSPGGCHYNAYRTVTQLITGDCGASQRFSMTAASALARSGSTANLAGAGLAFDVGLG